jgi:hypothetical protein
MAEIYHTYCEDDAANKLSKVADLVTIYIEEAHPRDGWFLPNANTGEVTFRQPTSTAERLNVAAMFVKATHFNLPLYVDTYDNEANYLYDAWPERLYVIQDGVVVYQGGNGPFGYRLDEVKAWLVRQYGERALPASFTPLYNPSEGVCHLKK